MALPGRRATSASAADWDGFFRVLKEEEGDAPLAGHARRDRADRRVDRDHHPTDVRIDATRSGR